MSTTPELVLTGTGGVDTTMAEYERSEPRALDSAAYEEVCGVFVFCDDETRTRLTRSFGYPWFWSAPSYRTDVYVIDLDGRVRGVLTYREPARMYDRLVLQVHDALRVLGIPEPFYGMVYFASRPWDGSGWKTPFGHQDIFVELIGRQGYAAGVLNTIAPLNHEGLSRHHGVKFAAPKAVLGPETDSLLVMVSHSSDVRWNRTLQGRVALCAPDGTRSPWSEAPPVPPFGSRMLWMKATFPDWERYVDPAGRTTVYFEVPPGGVLIPFLFVRNRAVDSWAIEHTRPPRHYVFGYTSYAAPEPNRLKKAVGDATTLAGYRIADGLAHVKSRLPAPVVRHGRSLVRRLRAR
jgi:hypothetical protein